MPKIGPNSIIQLGRTLIDSVGYETASSIYATAGITDLLGHPPAEMVEESTVIRLFRAVEQKLPCREAQHLLQEAGNRTGQYILKNRIPAVARYLLPILPRRMALAILLKAMKRNAWTFAGSGHFRYELEPRICMEIENNPLVLTFGCPWHTAVFNTLIGALVRPRPAVREDGGATPRFIVQ